MDGVYAPDVIVKVGLSACHCCRSIYDNIPPFPSPSLFSQVTRRILRHHKKLFKEDVEYLCLFITASCEAVNCMLSESYRREKGRELDSETVSKLAAVEGTDSHVDDAEVRVGVVSAASADPQHRPSRYESGLQSSVEEGHNGSGSVKPREGDGSDRDADRANDGPCVRSVILILYHCLPHTTTVSTTYPRLKNVYDSSTSHFFLLRHCIPPDRRFFSVTRRVTSVESLQAYEFITAASTSSLDKVSVEDAAFNAESASLAAASRLKREKWMVQKSADMMCAAGVVKMLVKVSVCVCLDVWVLWSYACDANKITRIVIALL